MTEQEAIKAISVEGLNIGGPARRVTEFCEGMTIAEKALQEIQLYHERKLSLVPSDGLDKICEELDSYREIGTIKECSETVEKKKEIRNKAIDDFYESIVEEYKQMKSIPDIEKATLNTIAMGIRERLKEGGANE